MDRNLCSFGQRFGCDSADNTKEHERVFALEVQVPLMLRFQMYVNPLVDLTVVLSTVSFELYWFMLRPEQTKVVQF